VRALGEYSNGSHTGITNKAQLKNHKGSSNEVMFPPGFIKIRQVFQNIIEIDIRKDIMTPTAHLSLYKYFIISSLIREAPMYIFLNMCFQNERPYENRIQNVKENLAGFYLCD
jgi:hypothetical protein